jgi:hypothetical protein
MLRLILRSNGGKEGRGERHVESEWEGEGERERGGWGREREWKHNN